MVIWKSSTLMLNRCSEKKPLRIAACDMHMQNHFDTKKINQVGHLEISRNSRYLKQALWAVT